MRMLKQPAGKIELIGLILLGLALIAVPVLVSLNAPWKNTGSNEYKVVHLTAVAKNGVWTDEKVTGLNYWNKTFKSADLHFKQGEKILFRLTSMDATHTFYVPELNIGPIEVKAGHYYEVRFIANKPGKFLYYCTTICGKCHFYMQGNITIKSNDGKDYSNQLSTQKEETIQCDHVHFVKETSSFIESGKSLFESKGCITCHGENGEGGIYNPNYINNFVPTLNDLADKMKLYWKEDADIIIKLFEENVNLEKLLDDPPISRYNRFYAQYESMVAKITDGAHELEKMDIEGPSPPLYMPAWKYEFENEEIKSILAYLIDQYEWED